MKSRIINTLNTVVCCVLFGLLDHRVKAIINKSNDTNVGKLAGDLEAISRVLVMITSEDVLLCEMVRRQTAQLLRFANREIGYTSFDFSIFGKTLLTWKVPDALPQWTLGFSSTKKLLEFGVAKNFRKEHSTIGALKYLYTQLGGKVDENNNPVISNEAIS